MKLQNKPDETKRTTQVRLFLSLTVVMSVQLVSAANGKDSEAPRAHPSPFVQLSFPLANFPVFHNRPGAGCSKFPRTPLV
jgi:hypothetical protein